MTGRGIPLCYTNTTPPHTDGEKHTTPHRYTDTSTIPTGRSIPHRYTILLSSYTDGERHTALRYQQYALPDDTGKKFGLRARYDLL
jgi:hypothetical protein